MIKEILDELDEANRRALYFAFDNNLTHYILLKGDRFIGVNTEHIAFLIPDSTISRGKWTVGDVAATKIQSYK